MFIGHFGLGLAAKKIAPKVSLGTWLMAVQLLDLIWPTFLLLGVEKVVIHPELKGSRTLAFTYYPFTHSLLGAIGWSVVFGVAYRIISRSTKDALLLGLAVFSHWVLDLMVHFHDLPLYPGSATYVGFGLWANLPVTAIIETALFVTGIVLYFTSTTAKNRKGKWNIWLLIILLVATHVYSFWAPPPASIKELAWSAQVQWVFVLLAYWGDRNRKPTHLSMS